MGISALYSAVTMEVVSALGGLGAQPVCLALVPTGFPPGRDLHLLEVYRTKPDCRKRGGLCPYCHLLFIMPLFLIHNMP